MKVNPQPSYTQIAGRQARTDGNGAANRPHNLAKPAPEARTTPHEKPDQTKPEMSRIVELIDTVNRAGAFMLDTVERMNERFLEGGDLTAVQRRAVSGQVAGFKDQIGSLLEAYVRGEIDREAVKSGTMEAFRTMRGAIDDMTAGDGGSNLAAEMVHGLDGLDVSG